MTGIRPVEGWNYRPNCVRLPGADARLGIMAAVIAALLVMLGRRKLAMATVVVLVVDVEVVAAAVSTARNTRVTFAT